MPLPTASVAQSSALNATDPATASAVSPRIQNLPRPKTRTALPPSGATFQIESEQPGWTRRRTKYTTRLLCSSRPKRGSSSTWAGGGDVRTRSMRPLALSNMAILAAVTATNVAGTSGSGADVGDAVAVVADAEDLSVGEPSPA